MEKRIYTILKEPTGQQYRDLILNSLDYCTSFFFVVRNTLPQNEQLNHILATLKPVLLKQSEEVEWPGTKLSSGTATVFRYRLSLDSATKLSNSTDGLFSWIQPDRPEDLTLIRDDGSPWLVTISHEKDAYLQLSQEERDKVIKAIPTLDLSL